MINPKNNSANNSNGDSICESFWIFRPKDEAILILCNNADANY